MAVLSSVEEETLSQLPGLMLLSTIQRDMSGDWKIVEDHHSLSYQESTQHEPGKIRSWMWSLC